MSDGSAARLPVVARFLLPDGRVFDHHTDVDARAAARHEGWWTEGNGSCDCHRSLGLNREYGLALGEPDEDDEPCLPCGDTIHLLALSVDGVDVVIPP